LASVQGFRKHDAGNTMTIQAEIKKSFHRVARAIAKRPALGRSTYVSTTRVQGLVCHIEEGNWRMQTDMPQQLGGQGTAPTPGMLGRAALGSCLATGYLLWASKMDVAIQKLEVEVQADSDDDGLFGTADTPPGYSEVRYCVSVDSSASEDEVLNMLDQAERHSPWLDVFCRPVSCKREVKYTATA
jgi:uncharacterized OsmC-like protein